MSSPPPQPLGREEGLEVELVTSGQCSHAFVAHLRKVPSEQGLENFWVGEHVECWEGGAPREGMEAS